jgi:hypothetical protein
MQTITLRSHVGADGVLRLDIPVDLADTDLEVVVTLQPLISPAADVLGRTAGSIPDLERPPQGNDDIRDTL